MVDKNIYFVKITALSWESFMSFFKNVKNKSVKVGKGLFGYDQIAGGTKENYSVFKEIIKSNLTKTESDQSEVYLSKQAVLDAKKGFLRLLIMFLFIFVIGVIYAIGNLLEGKLAIALLGFCFALLSLVLAFRYHFWLYQIKNQILGSTFKEYYNAEIKGLFSKKKPSSNK